MIKIESKNIDKIEKSYSRLLSKEFMSRISVITKVITLLNSTILIQKNQLNWNSDRTALKAVLNMPKLTSKNKDVLLNNFNSHRQSNPTRFAMILLDLQVYTNYIKGLLSAPPEDLKNIQTQISSNTSTPETDELIKYLFNYNYYYDDYIVPIAERLGLAVCPYCNRNYITHLQGKRRKRIIGPTFDHFFDQASNPYLTLSFYNLIPSCSVCNTNLKNQKEFTLDKHLHPYIHDADNDFVFDFNVDLLKKKSNTKIIFKPNIKYKVNKNSKEYIRLKGDKTKDSGSINVFKLREIYHTHSDIVEEIHNKFDKNGPHYIKSIFVHLKEMGVSEKEFYRYHFGNYYDKESFNKRPLAKLTKDIYEKMKSISTLDK